MKTLTLSILCLTSLACSGLAEDKPADNSAVNERDRSGETATSGDQSEKAEDIKITAAIRRAVMADDSLSVTAKNVKIITADGKVVLRGPVMSSSEKSAVARHAKTAAPEATIDDQLEIKEAN